MTRFESNFCDAPIDFLKSMITISMLPTDLPCLHLDYDDDFATDINTIHEISNFLKINISNKDSEKIFNKFEINNVKKSIYARNTINHNVDTLFHANHISDGKKGKWTEHLNSAQIQALDDALLPDCALIGSQWPDRPLLWNALFFRYYNGLSTESHREVTCDGGERCLIWGPYFPLPMGWWKIEFLIESKTSSKIEILKIDVNSIEKRGILSSSLTYHPFRLDEDHCYCIFFNENHCESLEFRVHSFEDGRSGSFIFHGIKISRIDRQWPQRNRDISVLN